VPRAQRGAITAQAGAPGGKRGLDIVVGPASTGIGAIETAICRLIIDDDSRSAGRKSTS
jgi:hypothetical protein